MYSKNTVARLAKEKEARIDQTLNKLENEVRAKIADLDKLIVNYKQLYDNIKYEIDHHKGMQDGRIQYLEEEVKNLRFLVETSRNQSQTEIDSQKSIKIYKAKMTTCSENTETCDNIKSIINNYFDNYFLSITNKGLVAAKGKNWCNHNLNSWLECRLKLKSISRSWKITVFGEYKYVEFQAIEYKHYIWSNKEKWDFEGIWIWYNEF